MVVLVVVAEAAQINQVNKLLGLALLVKAIMALTEFKTAEAVVVGVLVLLAASKTVVTGLRQVLVVHQ